MSKPPSPRPLSIKVITCYFVLSSMGGLQHGGSETILFWFVLKGTPSLIYNLIMAAVYGEIARRLWRLQEPSRKIAIGLQFYDVLRVILYTYSHDYTMLLSGFVNKWQQRGADPDHVRFLVNAGVLFIWLIPALSVVWFLIKRKSAFVRPAKSP